ncbi:MAG: hypothetical protein LBS59_06975 [Puniceicoccales bacterium]|nr:hypothetical protein [Puniceicoccales bacterium]
MEKSLSKQGFFTHNIHYPSLTAPIAQLADNAIGPAISHCQQAGAAAIHFVTHSMGGILVRSYLRHHPHPLTLGRTVMIAPPNNGSEVADALKNLWIYRRFFGPAGQELCTDANCTPKQLGPVNFELGVIAGNRSYDFICSRFFLRIPNDGKVTVESTRVEGMRDHLILSAAHTFIAHSPEVLRQTAHFLRHGTFSR